MSIKNAERNRRAGTGVQKIRIFSKDQTVPKQWKKFLSCGEDKENLVEFLCQHWVTYKSFQFGCLSTMYVTSRDKCYVFSSNTSDEDNIVCSDCPELKSNHEEADTRMLLHAKLASYSHDTTLIKSPDTDVFILSVAMLHSLGLKDLFMITGTGNKFRVIHINSISSALGEKLCLCLPGFHAFTGNLMSKLQNIVPILYCMIQKITFLYKNFLDC